MIRSVFRYFIGLVAVFYKASSAKNPFLGVILLIVGQLIGAGALVLEEKFLRNIDIHPI